MERRIPYSLYKTGYEQFPARDYDQKTKTILVELPVMKRRVWPKNWKRFSNHYTAPNGCAVYFWNTGLAQNYVVDGPYSPYMRKSRTIPAGFYSFEHMLQTVQEFGGTC